MQRIPAFVARATVALLIAAPLALGGCSKTTPTPPNPDCDGMNLLAFVSDRGQAAGQTKIYLYDLDQDGYRALPSIDLAGPEHSPALANDRRSMAFVTNRATGSDIVFYDRCTDRTLEVTDIITPFNEHDPAFSGDTQVLGFVRDTTGSQARIRLFDGQALKYLGMHAVDSLLSTGASQAGRPSLSQTANVVAFAANLGTGWDIFVYDRGPDTLRNVAFLNSAQDDVDPWMTPDGRYLVFASNRPGGMGGYDLYLYDLSTHQPVPLPNLNSPMDDRQPTMSDDANFFVFSSTRGGGHGGWDLWNYARPTQTVAQRADESSGGDDIQPWYAHP
jgi:Tol biopolymer transport system component